jgi:TRAP-type C4-dicarboxylate transport system substrate-binding protein
MKLSREENLRSVESLKKNGVELIPSPPQKEMQRFYQAGKQARRLLVPRLYSLELVEAVEKALEHFRENKKQ